MARIATEPPHPAACYLDPSLPASEQAALIAIAGGVRDPRALAAFAGLSNRGRRDDVLESLIRRGYIARDEAGLLSLSSVLAKRGGAGEPASVRRSAGSKLGAVLKWFVHHGRHLLAYGYSGVMALLDDAGVAWLSDTLRDLEASAEDDRAISRSLRYSRLAFVRRLVPLEYLDATRTAPRPAPADVLARAVLILASDDTKCSISHRAEAKSRIHMLFRALERLGERALAHWWRIVEESVRIPDLDDRWKFMLSRTASYLYQCRRLPMWMMEQVPEREELVRDFPIPVCGYGPWVEEELDLYQRFCRRYGSVLGPFTRSLWAQAHQAADAEMRRRYPGYVPEPHWEGEYRQHLWRQADVIADLDDDVRGALDREEYDHPEVQACYRGALVEWKAFERRRDWRAVLRHARDSPPTMSLDRSASRRRARRARSGSRRKADDLLRIKRSLDLEDTSEENWAPRLVVFWVRQAIGQVVDENALELAEDQWRHVLRARRRRYVRPLIATNIHHWAELDRPIIIPADGLASVDEITARVRGVVDRVRLHTKAAGSESAGDRRRKRVDRLAGLHAVAELYARRQTALLFYTSDHVRPCTLREALAAAGAEPLLWKVLEDAGLVHALGRIALRRLFGIESRPIREAA